MRGMTSASNGICFAVAVVEGDASGGAVAVGDEDAGVVCGHRGLMFDCLSLSASVPIARVGRRIEEGCLFYKS